MRRIIERTVRIVTTTIWRISWKEGLPSDPQAGSGTYDFPKADISLELMQRTDKFPQVIESKEVDISVTELVTKQTADVPPDDPIFLSNNERN